MPRRMHQSIRRILKAELTTTDDEGTRAATEAELHDRRIHPMAEDGDAIIALCNGYRGDTFPGEELTGGEGLNTRHLIGRMPEHLRKRCTRARVIRGPNLRSECEAAVTGILEARVPATGRISARPSDPDSAIKVLEEARRRAADEDDPAAELLVAEVDAEDVVVEDFLVPFTIGGIRQ